MSRKSSVSTEEMAVKVAAVIDPGVSRHIRRERERLAERERIMDLQIDAVRIALGRLRLILDELEDAFERPADYLQKNGSG
jgi:hypothetical protein